jgi:hypothetical protein
MRWKRTVLILALVIAAVACEGGTGGSASGSRERCHRSVGSGTCEGHFDRVTGKYTKKFEVGSGVGPPLVDLTVSVESGTLRVSYEASDGSTVSAETTPGSPATLSGDITSTFEAITVVFESVTEEARGIDYTLKFER